MQTYKTANKLTELPRRKRLVVVSQSSPSSKEAWKAYNCTGANAYQKRCERLLRCSWKNGKWARGHWKWNLELRWNFEHMPGQVVTVRGARSVVDKTSQKSSNITIIACVSASGAAIPPLIITKGKTPKSLYGYKTKQYQEKAWITDEIGEQPYFLSTVVLRGPYYSYLMAIRHTKH